MSKQKKSKSSPKLSQADVLLKLENSCKKMVSNTVQRYANGHYANVFNEAEMKALAADTALEVARRIEMFNQNPEQKGAVDPRGCDAYFCRAFINQCQKLYEKYAKTDIRAGVQTCSSDEALAVAASKNLENPENDWILKQEVTLMLHKMGQIDEKVNMAVLEQCERENRKPEPQELQYSKIILEKTLEGYEPNEIRKMINLSEVDYARHRRSSLELAKECVNFSLEDMIEHFNDKLDYRIYTKEVKKRKKSPNKARKYDVAPNFFIQSNIDHKNDQCTTSLFVRIDILDDQEVCKDFKPKLLKVEETVSSIAEGYQARENLWQKTKQISFVNKVKEMGVKHLEKMTKTA